MESINLSQLIHNTRMGEESKESWLRFAILALISEHGATDSDKFFPDRDPDKKTDAICNVELKINGIEVSFSHLLERLMEDFDYNLEKSVQEYIPTKVQEMMGKLQGTMDEFDWQIREVSKNFITKAQSQL